MSQAGWSDWQVPLQSSGLAKKKKRIDGEYILFEEFCFFFDTKNHLLTSDFLMFPVIPYNYVT